VTRAVPDNTRDNVADYENDTARCYRVTLSNPGTITLDMNPQIDALSIEGAQSQLVIGAPYTLEVLLDTSLSAGTLTMLPGGTLTTGTYTQTGGSPASRRLAACLGLGSGPQAFCVSAAATPTEGVAVTSQNHCALTRSAFRCRPDRLWPSPRPRLKAIGQGFGRAGHDPARPGFTKPFAKEDPSSPAVHPQGGRCVARPMVR
jgi:hypothetical protein